MYSRHLYWLPAEEAFRTNSLVMNKGVRIREKIFSTIRFGFLMEGFHCLSRFLFDNVSFLEHDTTYAKAVTRKETISIQYWFTNCGELRGREIRIYRR